MSLETMVPHLSDILLALPRFRSSSGLEWVRWTADETIVECHPPGDCYSVDVGAGLGEPVVTIETEGC